LDKIKGRLSELRLGTTISRILLTGSDKVTGKYDKSRNVPSKDRYLEPFPPHDHVFFPFPKRKTDRNTPSKDRYLEPFPPHDHVFFPFPKRKTGAFLAFDLRAFIWTLRREVPPRRADIMPGEYSSIPTTSFSTLATLHGPRWPPLDTSALPFYPHPRQKKTRQTSRN
jgi:hypothetical protein